MAIEHQIRLLRGCLPLAEVDRFVHHKNFKIAGFIAKTAQRKERKMSAGDKISNAAEGAKGKIKEGAGKATGNDKLEAEGKGDQVKADLKKAGENVKDTFKH